jgi:hypothetical protein
VKFRNEVDSGARLIDLGGAGCGVLLCELIDDSLPGPMWTKSQLRQKLWEILFVGARTTGKRFAAEAVLDKVGCVSPIP